MHILEEILLFCSIFQYFFNQMALDIKNMNTDAFTGTSKRTNAR